MLSNPPPSAADVIGVRSNGAPALARVNRSTSVEVKPTSCAATDTSVPRAIVADPGFTSIRYGLAASMPVTGTSTAKAPCRRYAGPNVKTIVATAVMTPSAASDLRRLWRSRPRPTSDCRHRSTADFTSCSSSSADSPARPRGPVRRADIDRAHQRLLERRFVLLQVERHLLVADAAAERPHEEEPAEDDEHHVGHHAGDDDGGRAEAEALEAIGDREQGEDRGADQHGHAAQHDLPAPAAPDPPDDVQQFVVMGHQAIRGSRLATAASMTRSRSPTARRYHQSDWRCSLSSTVMTRPRAGSGLSRPPERRSP